MHRNRSGFNKLGGRRIGGSFRQLFILIECFPAVAVRAEAKRSQTKNCLLLDRGVCGRRRSVGLGDGGVERFYRFVSVAGEQICATVKIQKRRIRRVEWILNS